MSKLHETLSDLGFEVTNPDEFPRIYEAHGSSFNETVLVFHNSETGAIQVVVENPRFEQSFRVEFSKWHDVVGEVLSTLTK